MPSTFSGIFLKNVSSVASLIFIGALAFILGTYVILEARRIEKLQKPLIFSEIWITKQMNRP